MTENIALTVVNLVIPKAGAEYELLFNNLDSVSLTSKLDLSNTAKCHHIIIKGCYEFGHTQSCSPARAFDQFLIEYLKSDLSCTKSD